MFLPDSCSVIVVTLSPTQVKFSIEGKADFEVSFWKSDQVCIETHV